MAEYDPIEFRIEGSVKYDLIAGVRALNDELGQMRNQRNPLGDLPARLDETGYAFHWMADKAEEANENLAFITIRAKSAGISLERFLASVKRIAFYRAIRAVLREIAEGFSEGRDNAYQYSKIIGGEFAASMDRLATATLYLKNSIGAMVMPIYNAVIPAIDFLIDKFVMLLNIVNQVFSLLNGASYWTKALKYPKEYAEAANAATGAVKELQKSILGFDEINKLNKQSTGGGGGLADALDYSKMFQQTDFSSFIQKHLEEIQAILYGFEFVLGAILFLAGHPIIGLAMMAHGAYKLFKLQAGLNWGEVSETMLNTLATIQGALFGFSVALGVLMLALGLGKLPLALGLIAFGAAGLFGVNLIELDINGVNKTLQTMMSGIMGIVLGASLAIGVILLMFATNPLAKAVGLGLIVAGVVGIANAIAINWDDMPEKVQNILSNVAQIVSFTLASLGAILIVASHPELGIPLLVAGLAVMATTINWNEVPSLVTMALNKVVNLLPYAIGAIGLVLLFSGHPELGIPLLVGSLGLIAAKVNWEELPNKVWKIVGDVQRAWNSLKSWLNSFHLPQLNMSATRTVNLFGQSISLPILSFYASGGFPDRGSLFVAGESGAEMVGSLGGKTAVANSDQIVQGIAEGLKYANADELRLMREQNDLLRQILAKEGTATVSLSGITTALERKNQRDGGTYVPVG